MMAKDRKARLKLPVVISGPNTLTHVVKGNKHIRLFGEYHERCNCPSLDTRKKRLVSITEYLHHELIQGDVDLYIEAPIIHLQTRQKIALFYTQLDMYNKHMRGRKLHI